MRVAFRPLLGILTALGVTSCGDGTPTQPAALPVARVVFDDSLVARDVGQSATSVVRLYDRNGAPLLGRVVTYASADLAVARVDAQGTVTAVAPGSVTVTATSEGQSGRLRFVVHPPPPVAAVTLPNERLTLVEGATAANSATTRDSLGRTLTDRRVVYTSSDPAVAAVDSTGRVVAVAPGTATVSATSEGRAASAVVTVLPRPVARVAFAASQLTLDEAATATAAATPYDSAGRALVGRVVTYASSDPAVATVDATGRVAGASAGTATITATSEGQRATLAVTVRAVLAVVTLALPRAQPLVVGDTTTLVVSAASSSGTRLGTPGATFTSRAPGVATVDGATGFVRAVSVGTAIIDVVLGGKSASVTVTVVAPPPTRFDVDVRFLAPVAPDLQALVRGAVARWAEVITGPAVQGRLDVPEGRCGPAAVHETVQGLLLVVQVGAIDGAGGTIASSGPCVIRDVPGATQRLPLSGVVVLDSVDVRLMLTRGQSGMLRDVVLHEIGHVLGVGTLWNLDGRVLLPGALDPSADLYYVGSEAARASAALGFGTGASVPVENGGGPGSRGGHWRESTYGSELMTPYIAPANPLSAITVGALRDLGYTVSTAAADPFSPALAARGAVRLDGSASSPVPLDERLLFPRFLLDRAGRLVALPSP